MLQTQTVTAETLALIRRLMGDPRFNDFILVGGTALSLTIGNRQSIDIDLFTGKDIDAGKMASILADEYKADRITTLKNGVFCLIDNVKTDLVAHPYPLVESSRTIEGIRIVSLTDIAAMKLHAIVNNGTRLKDYADVYSLLEQMPLDKMYAAYEQKYYPNASGAIARMGLIDHREVNLSNEIVLLNEKFDWKKITDRIREAVENPAKIFRSQALPFSQSACIKKALGRKRGRGL